MTIKVNGKDVEAYRLIMRKTNALDILKGTKKIEIRDFSKTYGDMFIDPEKEKVYLKKMEEPDFEYIDKNGVAECDKIYKDTKYIYFTNYNNSWDLVAEIEQIFMLWFTDDDMEFLSKELNFHDLEESYKEYKANGHDDNEDGTPAFFAIELKGVVSHRGLA
ncbi:hypothetical protein SAMN05444369_101291 [Capnocytophaga haemolytica]|jgi:hypothetical protein|uniref:ASCH domain-containing protein n=1 Tax=Capnocytophaga haemolytica TaxID=45243 RepID=A0AAX2GXP5_9FLAO|nr:hypothetical protein [Capnocytophaga haemolytica]AMD85115.1 hypothetical protein AXF12_06030 [Capnocytophaga haemolytica]SFN67731.1 hypothetical protein SAMN05444369_101291 [Capnocytophaga haemolytica]SNV04901.1 Uncharacterised protein [Capnocytophaga haemolytica]